MFISAASGVSVNMFILFSHRNCPQVVRRLAHLILSLDRPPDLTACMEIDIKDREMQRALLAGGHN